MKFELICLDLDNYETKDDINKFLEEYKIKKDFLNLDELIFLKKSYKYVFIDKLSGCAFSFIRRNDGSLPLLMIDLYGPFMDFMFSLESTGFVPNDELVSNKTLLDLIKNDFDDISELSIDMLEFELNVCLDNEDYERASIIRDEIEKRKG